MLNLGFYHTNLPLSAVRAGKASAPQKYSSTTKVDTNLTEATAPDRYETEETHQPLESKKKGFPWGAIALGVAGTIAVVGIAGWALIGIQNQPSHLKKTLLALTTEAIKTLKSGHYSGFRTMADPAGSLVEATAIFRLNT
jgi:hypothetical protein